MSMLKRTALKTAPALVGAAISVAIIMSHDFGERDERAARSEAPTSAAEAERPVAPRVPQGWARRMPRHRPPSDIAEEGADSAEPAPSEASAWSEEDLEQARDRVLGMWEEQLDDHEAAAIDSQWARSVAPQFNRDLEAIGEEAFAVADVDCRTTTCVATLDFASYGAAQASLAGVLHHPYAVNCATTFVIPEPEDRAAAYSANVLFDCPAEG